MAEPATDAGRLLPGAGAPHRGFGWSDDATADAMRSVALRYGLGLEDAAAGAAAVVCYVCSCRTVVARAACGELGDLQAAAFRGFVGVHARCARNLRAGVDSSRAAGGGQPTAGDVLEIRREGPPKGAFAKAAAPAVPRR